MSTTTPHASTTLLIIGAMGTGAFLLFFIQPIVGKAILPYLGGSSSIWATTLAFFTTALCVGYVYVHILSQYSLSQQVRIHTTLLWLSVASIACNTLTANPLSLPLTWFAEPSAPVVSLGLILMLSIGLPYILLAATAPLLQHWYTHLTHKEPYPLYSISNLGSLAGLLAYPFLFEPYLALTSHAWVWLGLFILFCIQLWHIMRHVHGTAHTPTVVTTAWREWFVWVGISALPTALLVATTTYITQVIAPVPLLWIIPLTIYLLSFIIAYSGLPLGPTALVLSGGVIWRVLTLLLTGNSTVEQMVILLLVTLFLVSTALHQYVYTRRPTRDQSSWLYVATSFGGALGSVAVSVGAPLLLADFFELHIILLCAFVTLCVLGVRMFAHKDVPHFERVALVAIAVICIATYAHDMRVKQADIEGVRERNFYGVTRIVTGEETRRLNHGTTLHGEQFLDSAREFIPTSYYSTASGVGRAISLQRTLHKGAGLHIGVVGLGTGTLASYCGPEDSLTYYEIDERMVRIATTAFTFLAQCPQAEVRMGDGRLSLATESDTTRYDILAIDAFSDDSVPTHLVTEEAVRVFLSRVADDGILAIHTSNRYIDLTSVILRIAEEIGTPVTVVQDSGDLEGASASVWILLSSSYSVIASPALAGSVQHPADTTPLWTDAYTPVLPVLFTPITWERVTEYFVPSSNEDEM